MPLGFEENGRYLLPNAPTGLRETIITSPLRAEPQYLQIMPGPSIWPLLGALFTAGFFLLLTVQAYTPAVISGILAVPAIMRWLWETDRPVAKAEVDVGGGIRLPTYATGSGTQRLYGFRDILVLKLVKRLLDTGISLHNIRVAVDHLRQRGVQDLANITLFSDGTTVYECTSAEEVVDHGEHQPRLEGASAVPRSVQGDVADLAGQRLRRRAVARVRAAASGWVAPLITEVVGQFGLQTALEDRLDHLREEPALTGQLQVAVVDAQRRGEGGDAVRGRFPGWLQPVG